MNGHGHPVIIDFLHTHELNDSVVPDAAALLLRTQDAASPTTSSS